MRALAKAGIAVGVVAALATIGITVLLDADRIKAGMAAAMLENKQRTLKIDGPLALSLWPNLGFTLGRFSLSERGSALAFASADSIRVSVALRPLLSKQVVVDAIEAHGIAATIVRHRDGTLNIDDLLATDATESPPLDIDIAGIRLADARLSWRDEKSGRAVALTGIDLASGHVSGNSGSKTFRIEAPALTARLDAAGDKLDLKFAAPNLSLAAGAFAADAATLTLLFNGGDWRTDVRMRLAGIEGSALALKIAGLAADIDAKSAAATAKGTLGTALGVDIERRALTLDGLDGDFKVVLAQRPAQGVALSFSGALRADLARQTAIGEVKARVDDSKAALRFDVEKFSPPTLSFDLDIDRLDADRYLAPRKRSAQADHSDGLALTKDFDIDGRVAIGSLRVAGIGATNVVLRVRGAGGRLDIGQATDRRRAGHSGR